jgi:hypothetical protein
MKFLIKAGALLSSVSPNEKVSRHGSRGLSMDRALPQVSF